MMGWPPSPRTAPPGRLRTVHKSVQLKPASTASLQKEERLYSTCASPVVPHLSTRHAHGCLASEIGRDPAFPTRYDHTENSSRVSSPDRLAVATRPRSNDMMCDREPMYQVYCYIYPTRVELSMPRKRSRPLTYCCATSSTRGGVPVVLPSSPRTYNIHIVSSATSKRSAIYVHAKGRAGVPYRDPERAARALARCSRAPSG